MRLMSYCGYMRGKILGTSCQMFYTGKGNFLMRSKITGEHSVRGYHRALIHWDTFIENTHKALNKVSNPCDFMY